MYGVLPQKLPKKYNETRPLFWAFFFFLQSPQCKSEQSDMVFVTVVLGVDFLVESEVPVSHHILVKVNISFLTLRTHPQ